MQATEDSVIVNNDTCEELAGMGASFGRVRGESDGSDQAPTTKYPRRQRVPSDKVKANLAALEAAEHPDEAPAQRSRKRKPASATPAGADTKRLKAQGGKKPAYFGTCYELGALAAILRNVPEAELAALLQSSDPNLRSGDGPSSSAAAMPFSSAELKSMAGLHAESRRPSTVKAYVASANKLEWFLKYGHDDDIVQRWSEATLDRQLPQQHINLSSEDGQFMATRAIRWAGANFPGYYEAMNEIDKKSAVITKATLENFAAALSAVYKLQVTHAGLVDSRPERIRGYTAVDTVYVSVAETLKQKDTM
jgi:hypothetical protein